jgi:hypothetical protein
MSRASRGKEGKCSQGAGHRGLVHSVFCKHPAGYDIITQRAEDNPHVPLYTI